MSQKVVKLGLIRGSGDLLYIKRVGTSDKNEIWRKPKVGIARVNSTTTFSRQKGMLYFIDAEGDVSCVPTGKRSLPARKAQPVKSGKKRATKSVSSVYVSLVFDDSSSMSVIADAARNMFNKTIAAVKAGETPERRVFVSLYWFGERVSRALINAPSANLSEIYSYAPRQDHTCLLDAVAMAIADSEETRKRCSDDTSFVINVITDGAENFSSTPARDLLKSITAAQQTDKYTLTFQLPPGHAAGFCAKYGVPRGNVTEWAATEAGADHAATQSQTGFGQYWAAHSSGVRSVKTFYADASKITSSDVKKLNNITSRALVITAKKEAPIRELVEAKTHRPLTIGAAFYQLMKPEKKVQHDKQLLIRDKKSGDVYAGSAVRAHLGLPVGAPDPDWRTASSLKPGNHAGYDIFVQSKSVNRIVPRGTDVIYWVEAAVK